MTKKWVYKELVTNPNDIEGIIAYSLYKSSKDKLADSLRNKDKTEDQINEELLTFHDQTLLHNGIDDYRDKAKSFLVSLYSQVHSDLEKQHKREIRNLETDLLSKVRDYQRFKQPWYSMFWSWCISGIPSIISSFVITILVLGLYSWVTSEDTKKDVLKYLAETFLNLASQ